MIGANITVPALGTGTVSDADGSFDLTLPVGTHDLVIQYIGYATGVQPLTIHSDGNIALQISRRSFELEEVTIRADAPNVAVQRAQIGVATLDLQSVRQLPAFFGEADVVKSLLLYPGVSTIGEGATGFNVRGGEVDQNLIILDDGMLMSSSHALGFYSAFNADVISRVDLFKGNIPAEYGGRLASVMDIRMRDGNFSDFRMRGGVGPVASRLTAEGPLIRDKLSFLLSGRFSHANWVLNLIKVPEVQNSHAFFYDGNARLTARLSDKNSLIFSAYTSGDEFGYNGEFGFDYRTSMLQGTYKSIFSNTLYSNLSVTASEYQSTRFDYLGERASRLRTGVRFVHLKEKLTWQPNVRLRLDTGFSTHWYKVQPGQRAPLNIGSLITAALLEEELANESAVFASTEYTVTPALQVTGGLRFAFYRFNGPKTVFSYENPERPVKEEIMDTTFINKGKIATYHSLEPRISLRYNLTRHASIKAGYSRTAQFINQIFNSDSPTPTSQWQLSTAHIAPQRSHNYSIGYFHNIRDDLWETSCEVYVRQIDELFDYRDFADLLINPHIETELLSGIGRTYGIEFSVRKREGIVNGWASYTISRAEQKVNGINRGQWYPGSYDKTHVGALVINYQPNRRNTLTMNFNYSTGRPTTAPVGTYTSPDGLVIPAYSRRNQLRIPDYHRLDIAYTVGKGYKKDKRIQTSWTFSVYNVYGRKNAFSVFYTQAAFQHTQSNRLSILGSAFPALTLNFEFL